MKGILRGLLRGTALSLVLLLATETQAHRQHFGWSAVVYQVEAQRIEITHRFHAHDVALLLTRLNHRSTDITALRSQAEFIIHIENQFDITANVAEQRLTTLGAELDGPYLLVYQELELSGPASSLDFDASMLMDLYPDQIHVINLQVVGQESRAETIEFTLKSPSQQITLISTPAAASN